MFGKITHYSDPEIRKMLIIDLLAILKRIRIEWYFATFCRIFESAQY